MYVTVYYGGDGKMGNAEYSKGQRCVLMRKFENDQYLILFVVLLRYPGFIQMVDELRREKVCKAEVSR